jgi:hypothetical protein
MAAFLDCLHAAVSNQIMMKCWRAWIASEHINYDVCP